MREIKKVAIANRGEVAARIIRACKEVGIQTALLHSKADTNSRAYRMADERICIGDSPAGESYLDIQKNIDGLLACGADALHPGFGFLSENAEFAEAVGNEDAIFIGPPPEAIRNMGDKITAKSIIAKAGVPTVPGYEGDDQSIKTLAAKAAEIGYPVIVKAAAGGGGRGMKIISKADEAEAMIESAQREAKSAFGNDRVFLEKYLDRAKHIEVQIFADLSGKAVHLFERECSVQRRHQKIIEEALSGSLTMDLRKKICKAAVELAQAVNYVGAGTVEFLVQDDKFYFLEMNTRLQVEHPVTEFVMGVDLVKAQILTMANRFHLWPQDSLIPRGHSIECRIYAEDPFTAGIPSTGKLGFQYWPEGPGRRFDFGFDKGDEITAFYDSMIAKAIVWDETRDRAIQKMQQALSEIVIFGVKTNIPLLHQILAHQNFLDASFTTQFMSQNFSEGAQPGGLSDLEDEFSVFAQKHMSQPLGNAGASVPSPFADYWRNT